MDKTSSHIYLHNRAHDQRCCHSDTEHQHIWQELHRQSLALLQQRRQEGQLAIRVRRVSRTARKFSYRYMDTNQKQQMSDLLRGQLLADRVEILCQARFPVDECIERVLSVIGTHTTGSDASEWQCFNCFNENSGIRIIVVKCIITC